METGAGKARPELRALSFAALVLALLVVAGLASSGSVWSATGAASPSTTALQGLAAAGGVVLVVAVLLLWVETPVTRRLKRRRRPLTGDEFEELGASFWTAGKALAVVLLALAVLAIAALPLLSSGPAPSGLPTGAHRSVRAAPLRSQGENAAGSLDLGWLLFPIAVTLVFLAPAAALIRRRRLQREAVPDEDAGELGRAVRASIAALESERDPRRAILRAYARMEQAFRNVEIVRARDETASEFASRTARRLPVSAGAAAALTERFEEVRYSTHQITEADREDALVSLRRVEQELARRP